MDRFARALALLVGSALWASSPAATVRLAAGDSGGTFATVTGYAEHFYDFSLSQSLLFSASAIEDERPGTYDISDPDFRLDLYRVSTTTDLLIATDHLSYHADYDPDDVLRLDVGARLDPGDYYVVVSALGIAGSAQTLALGQGEGAYDFTYAATAVPEPEAWALMAGGLGLIGGLAHRRRARRETGRA